MASPRKKRQNRHTSIVSTAPINFAEGDPAFNPDWDNPRTVALQTLRGDVQQGMLLLPHGTAGDDPLPEPPTSPEEDALVRLAAGELRLMEPDQHAEHVSLVPDVSSDSEIGTPKAKTAQSHNVTKGSGIHRGGAHVSWVSGASSSTGSTVTSKSTAKGQDVVPPMPPLPRFLEKPTPRSSIAPKSVRTTMMTTFSSELSHIDLPEFDIEPRRLYTHAASSADSLVLGRADVVTNATHDDDEPSTPELTEPGTSASASVRSSASSHGDECMRPPLSRQGSLLDQYKKMDDVDTAMSNMTIRGVCGRSDSLDEHCHDVHQGDYVEADTDDVAAIYSGPRNPNRFTLSTVASAENLRGGRFRPWGKSKPKRSKDPIPPVPPLPLAASSGNEVNGLGPLYLNFEGPARTTGSLNELPAYKPTPKGTTRRFQAMYGCGRSGADKAEYGSEPRPGTYGFLQFPNDAVITVLGDWGSIMHHPGLPYGDQIRGLEDSSKIRLLLVHDAKNRRGWALSYCLADYQALK